MSLGRHHRAELIARFQRRLAGPHQRFGWPASFRFVLDGTRRRVARPIGPASSSAGTKTVTREGLCRSPQPRRPVTLAQRSLDEFDDLLLLGEALGEVGMGIGVVSSVFIVTRLATLSTPRGIVNARAFARLFRTCVETTAIDVYNRQSRNDRGLGRRLLVLELVHPPIPILLQLLADFVGDPPHLTAADVDFSFVSERFRGVVKGSTSRGGAEDLTKDRRREVVRVEPQARRRGKKMPATCRAMTAGFGVLDCPAANLNGS